MVNKFKVGDRIIQCVYVEHLKKSISWCGEVIFAGPIEERFRRNYIRTQHEIGIIPPILFDNQYWIKWDNGSENRVDENRIEFDQNYLREIKLNKLL